MKSHEHFLQTTLPRRAFLASLLSAAPLLSGCRGVDFALWQPPEASPEAYEVNPLHEIRYHHGPDASTYHRLDAYVPRGATAFPVALIVHGGGWMIGDKFEWGLYASVGQFLARHGIAAVLPNYQLSPSVRHPRHVRDVALALAWTYQHISGLGGRPDQIFLIGHSAGGHLVSLLATHPNYLASVNVPLATIPGVISVCGVYQIPNGPVELRLGGPTSNALRPGQILPVRANSSHAWLRSPVPGIPVALNVYAPVFGDDPITRRDASPLTHVRSGLPPFLLANAENDLPTLPEMANDFHRALCDNRVPCEQLLVAARNHSSVFLNATHAEDPLGRAMLAFIQRYSAPVLPA